MSTMIEREIPGGSNTGCAGCAYRAGNQTRKEPWNVIRAQVCAEGAVPFYCHEGLANWQMEDGHGLYTKEQLGQMKLCAGWKAAVLKRSRNPAWRAERKTKHALAVFCMGALVTWQREKKDKKRKRQQERLWKWAFCMLFGLKEQR
jgi:hypothetical protein